MKRLHVQRRTLTLLAVVLPIGLLFVYVILRSGPLAPVAVTTTTIRARALTPALFGIGTVEARYTYRVGPTFAGRVQQVDVQVGEHVKAGQLLGLMDPVDLDARIDAQDAAIRRAIAQLRDAEARQRYAQTQSQRYEKLLAVHAISVEMMDSKRQELQVAVATRSAASEALAQMRADRAALQAQRANLRLTAPVNALVTRRDADPGTTIVAGQPVIELIDPRSLWVNTRFDQLAAQGLAAGLPAQVTLRSRSGQTWPAHVLWVDPLADAVTEETLAKVVFKTVPKPLPPLGELAQVTVSLPPTTALPVVPNAAIRQVNGVRGVWKLVGGDLHFSAVELGASDLEGNVQVRKGVRSGDRIVVYSEDALSAHSNIHVVDHIVGVAP
ncbi:efflux RND transporter periplasmic adaptor subunit [Dyella sp. A6]|uniref:efflux RND transporter periplasmic adaptor subunit n=1 Tax=Dyella aluminiiresistens TaxID=3069105 RepID=UPI002E7A52CC|nr:efflux RND transporter periplasmic adaptor subunit [Dyella sp. A6]